MAHIESPLGDARATVSQNHIAGKGFPQTAAEGIEMVTVPISVLETLDHGRARPYGPTLSTDGSGG